MRNYSSLLIACVLAGLLTGCGSLTTIGRDPQPYVNKSRLDKGLVIVLTGIEGRSTFNEAICRGLAEGGVPYSIELEDWTAYPGAVPGAMLLSQRAEDRNRRKAAEIADRISRYEMNFPGRPVLLVGQSGGGAMAIWIMESLPMGERVDGAILLAASLSPEYRLDRALYRSRRGIISFHSQNDWLFLGLGTTVTGTMDGLHESSAGRVGFRVPEKRPPSYAGLYQVVWNQQMRSSGNWGVHLTSGASGFVSQYVAPLVKADPWNQDLLSSLSTGAAQAQAPAPAPKQVVREKF